MRRRAAFTEQAAATAGEPIDPKLRAQAEQMARSLGIPLYIRDGAIHQHGPGECIAPPTTKAADLDSGFGSTEEQIKP
jgi:hypothetical protein